MVNVTALTKIHGNVRVIIFCLWTGSESIDWDPHIESWGSEGTPFHSKLLRGSLDAAGYRFSPRLGEWFMSKDYIWTSLSLSHLDKISKFQCAYSQFTYQVFDTIRIPTQGLILMCHPLPFRRPQWALGCPYGVYGVRWLSCGHFCILTTDASSVQVWLE